MWGSDVRLIGQYTQRTLIKSMVGEGCSRRGNAIHVQGTFSVGFDDQVNIARWIRVPLSVASITRAPLKIIFIVSKVLVGLCERRTNGGSLLLVRINVHWTRNGAFHFIAKLPKKSAFTYGVPFSVACYCLVLLLKIRHEVRQFLQWHLMVPQWSLRHRTKRWNYVRAHFH